MFYNDLLGSRTILMTNITEYIYTNYSQQGK